MALGTWTSIVTSSHTKAVGVRVGFLVASTHTERSSSREVGSGSAYKVVFSSLDTCVDGFLHVIESFGYTWSVLDHTVVLVRVFRTRNE